MQSRYAQLGSRLALVDGLLPRQRRTYLRVNVVRRGGALNARADELPDETLERESRLSCVGSRLFRVGGMYSGLLVTIRPPLRELRGVSARKQRVILA